MHSPSLVIFLQIPCLMIILRVKMVNVVNCKIRGTFDKEIPDLIVSSYYIFDWQKKYFRIFVISSINGSNFMFDSKMSLLQKGFLGPLNSQIKLLITN